MVALVARQIDDGAVANLGIGMRKRVATHLSAGKEVMLHSENVVIGEGPAAAAVEEDHNLIGAGKQSALQNSSGADGPHWRERQRCSTGRP